MVYVACGTCWSHGRTVLNMTSNGHVEGLAIKKEYDTMLQDIDDVPNIHFPIYGKRYVTSYLDSYAYVFLVESPGVAFLTVAEPPATHGMVLIRTTLIAIPLVGFLLTLTAISGFFLWMFVS